MVGAIMIIKRVIFYILAAGDYDKAYEIMRSFEAKTTEELIIKAVTYTFVGQENESVTKVVRLEIINVKPIGLRTARVIRYGHVELIDCCIPARKFASCAK